MIEADKECYASAATRLERRLSRFKHPLSAERANRLVNEIATSAEDARWLRLVVRDLHSANDPRLAF